ncbi:N-acetyl-gamma-glutamyl-phosphate reductase [Bowdeniella nasicola]|uniref:N-acetyl-gamma-glutamyl-phosphate reductase n=1 Tax=Bowdeniella nasicola TaxID=208480 RepID=A0A1Q5Q0V3_9ACTO|nr:N-acetyl-gamma-glutamyl-phosphate reductase [Bowdeniella nasicola]OKL53494.1 N-acetyl-gamma-glutamyl-phosphate reductase [Bowdeniella nasicola]
MTLTVAVVGASGAAGGEALRLLSAHDGVTITHLMANSSAGSLLGEHHPHLRVLADRAIEKTDVAALADVDVAILALPHGASGEIAAQLPDTVRVFDAGADHRLESAQDWQAYYGSEHSGTWPYGLPELLHAGEERAAAQREILAGASRVAVPGCNVTAVTLATQPGALLGDKVDFSQLVATLAVGYSGAGKALKPHLMALAAQSNAAPYAVGGTHRHIPEIEQNLRRAGVANPVVVFTPILVPMNRGILASVTVPTTASAAELREVWEAVYADEPFIHLLPEGVWPTTQAVQGANIATVQVTKDEHSGQLIAQCAIDNLAKGTAGGLIQSMNLALGLPETMGLPTDGTP